MNGRLLLAENGGYTVQNLLLLWTAFLPLGDRFSLDALLASMKRRREASAAELNDRTDVLLPEQARPVVTALGPILLIQLAAIYFFNVVHKTGREWKDGTAVHYVLYVDRMATPLIALVRDHIPDPVIKLLTRSALAMEASISVALLSPIARTWSRRIAIVLINALHLGFGVTFVLGPFAWACCVFSTLLFTTEDWEVAHRAMRRKSRARTVIFDPLRALPRCDEGLSARAPASHRPPGRRPRLGGSLLDLRPEPAVGLHEVARLREAQAVLLRRRRRPHRRADGRPRPSPLNLRARARSEFVIICREIKRSRTIASTARESL